MRLRWIVPGAAALFLACPCPKHVDPAIPSEIAFDVPAGHPILAEFLNKDAAIRASPRPAALVAAACSDAFTTLVAGRYCQQRMKDCCSGVDCRASDAAAACTPQKMPELGFLCCTQAAPAFFQNVSACAGMAVRECVLDATPEGPKAIDG